MRNEYSKIIVNIARGFVISTQKYAANAIK